METSWHSYPKIYALGHRAINELLFDNVVVEEKIDGSQFSFGLFEDGFKARSKGQQLIIDAPEKMFQDAVSVVQTLDLKKGWTYRGEYLQKPRHNTLNYNRIPEKHIIIFDINIGHEEYFSYDEKAKEAERIGLEVVPLVKQGKIDSAEIIKDFLGKESCLGGPNMEGVVIKNYSRFGVNKKALMGKFVSEEFKEVHQKKWKEDNPKSKDVVLRLSEQYKTTARWEKAIQHLREKGLLDESPKDIGNLIKEIQSDTKGECIEEIKEVLFKWAWPNIERGIIRGFPQWYKEKLLDKQFE